MLKNGLYLFFFLFSFSGLAQKEGNIWYFGNQAGLDFNSGSPVPLTDGLLSTTEGCATISDNNGNLLFYTDGITVWNKNHLIMPNGFGLTGDPSSSQSAVIVKKPGSNSIYYIFTVAAVGGPAGLSYSEVDMTLNGGLGDVTIIKNFFIVGPISEKVCAVKHQNGVDFWIVTHLPGATAYHSYLLSSTGLNTTPVITNIGAVVAATHTVGYLRASPNGTRMASANDYEVNFELFDFDNSTGVLSNAMIFSTGFAFPGPYGIEFSPNSNLLYVSPEAGSAPIYQYDLLAGSNVAIDNSQVLVGNATSNGGALQNGPDGKMYHTQFNSPALNVINDPNVLGVGCNFVVGSLNLAGKISTLGFPTFINSINTVSANFSATNLCFGDSTLFNILPNANGLDSVYWDFGDPATGSNNNSNDTMVLHQFSDTGTFNVTLVVFDSTSIDTTINQVIINPIPTVDLGNDTVYCVGSFVTLDATTFNASYLWQDGSSSPTFNASQSGTYWVEVTVSGCSATDTILVDSVLPPTVNIAGGGILCEGESITLSASGSNSSYLWQNNSTASTQLVTESGSYWVVATNSCGIDIDTVDVMVEECEIILVMPNVITPNEDDANDSFIPIEMVGISEASIVIFNRWGQMLFESSDIMNGWDGKCDGGDCSDGTYFWIVNYVDRNNESGVIKGTMSLLK